ncbi:MAG: SPOR domain-containing protein, partial [Bacteroidaceae bacterium]
MEKFIEKLLLKHDCVIIPALGGFVTHYESAYQDSESGMYYPPSRSISFNSQLKMNDGLLVQAYMQAFDTNFPEANRMVEHEAERIKSVLRSTGVFLFQNLGILELKENDRLLFTPQDEGGIAAPDLYGLDAFFMKQYVMQQKV